MDQGGGIWTPPVAIGVTVSLTIHTDMVIFVTDVTVISIVHSTVMEDMFGRSVMVQEGGVWIEVVWDFEVSPRNMGVSQGMDLTSESLLRRVEDLVLILEPLLLSLSTITKSLLTLRGI